MEAGRVKVDIRNSLGVVEFSHPKANSLPLSLLRELADSIRILGDNSDVRVILLLSEGSRTFCAGASFDELKKIDTVDKGAEFFMGFGEVILAMRDCPKFVVIRIQGKVVGGGLGLVAAADYALATSAAEVRLSEFDIGIGPFIIGPAVLRKSSVSAFSELAISTQWRSASWALEKGLYTEVHDDIDSLDLAVEGLTEKLAAASVEATKELKAVLWQGTENWPELLRERAAISGRLIIGTALN